MDQARGLAPPLDTWRCKECHNILQRHAFALRAGSEITIEVRCKCNAWNTLHVQAVEPTRCAPEPVSAILTVG